MANIQTDTKPATVTELKLEGVWRVVVLNDPVNLMSYVVFVFMRVLAFTKEKATKHMMEVHQQGKSVVATETRERAELHHQQIQSQGLKVTIEQAS